MQQLSGDVTLSNKSPIAPQNEFFLAEVNKSDFLSLTVPRKQISLLITQERFRNKQTNDAI